RVCGEHEKHIQRQAQGVAFNLNVAFLHDIEKSDLNFPREVRQFVDGEDAAVRVRQKPVVNGEFVREIAATLRGTNGIDVAEDVRHGDVRCRKFLNVTM